MVRRLVTAAALMSLLAAACSSDSSSDDATPTSAATPYAGYVSNQYEDGQNWLCHPEAEHDYCLDGADVTVVNADGSIEVEEHPPAEDPPVDCFYVYPTVSMDMSGNSDLEPGEEEIFVIHSQAARFSEVCRVFAPVYRQVTIPSLLENTLGSGAQAGVEGVESADLEVDAELPAADVTDAWKQYIANDNDGRGAVLIGHSQGTGRLTALIRDEIAGNPELEDLIVSALLIGGGVEVPAGEEIPEGFGDLGICQERSEAGCVVAYHTFRDTDPPEEDSEFFTAEEGHEAVCTNPAALEGGEALLTPAMPLESIPSLADAIGESPPPFADPDNAPEITTPFVSYPDFIRAECVGEAGAYLRVTILADPDDPRTDDIGGDIPFLPWGLHLMDINIAHGDLVDLVAAQTETYLAAG